MHRLLFTLLILISSITSAEERLEFTIHKLESNVEGPTVLVVGGIQGDEPGGFHAASLLVTHYRVTKGNIWVVPNLNFESIIERSRGVNGDMNRKFAHVLENDPDFQAVVRIKELIRNPDVDFVFNMHDGSGFYREEHSDWLHSPLRWGQSIIIDQESLDVERYPNVGELSRQTVAKINERLLDEEHTYHVKNTKTRDGDTEMAKTLTFFAINNGKAAVGLEASKTLSTSERAYYHLNALEHYFETLGVEFERSFELEPAVVQQAIDDNIQIAFYQNKLLLDIAKARSHIGYVPLQKNAELEFKPSNPLIAVTRKGKGYKVNYGNRSVTYLQPQFFDYDHSLDTITMEIDGVERDVHVGSVIEVQDNFQVNPQTDDYRVNVIGWTKQGVDNEAWQQIRKGSIRERFSIDEDGELFRVEVYNNDKFSGMILIRFPENVADSEPARQAPQALQQARLETLASLNGR
ncbi:MAG: deacylase [Sedimenticola sp.]|nr:MAG: deacylase [Sedimenticola sp.]